MMLILFLFDEQNNITLKCSRRILLPEETRVADRISFNYMSQFIEFANDFRRNVYPSASDTKCYSEMYLNKEAEQKHPKQWRKQIKIINRGIPIDNGAHCHFYTKI